MGKLEARDFAASISWGKIREIYDQTWFQEQIQQKTEDFQRTECGQPDMKEKKMC